MPKTAEMLKKLPENFKGVFQGEAPDVDKLLENITGIKYEASDMDALGALKEEVNVSTQKLMKKMSRFAGGATAEAGIDTSSMTDGITDLMTKGQALIFKTGKNACYLSNANKIITPEKALQTSVFHEMGHALNNNGNVLLKALQKARPAAKIIPAIVLTAALFNKRKTTDEKSDSKVQNFMDGVKKNAGKLTFLGMLPMIAEEGIASLRGGSLAKNLVKQGILSPETFKRVKLTNALGFSSYLMAGITAAAGAALAVKVKDNIQAKYEAKKNEQYDARDAKIIAKQEAKAAKKADKTTTNQ